MSEEEEHNKNEEDEKKKNEKKNNNKKKGVTFHPDTKEDDYTNVIVKEFKNNMSIAFIKTGKDGNSSTSGFVSFSSKVDALCKTDTMSPQFIETLKDCGYSPIRSKGNLYTQHCMGFFSSDELVDVKKRSNTIFKKYTSDPGWYCTQLNLMLAADSKFLAEKQHSTYVRELKCCIGLKKNW